MLVEQMMLEIFHLHVLNHFVLARGRSNSLFGFALLEFGFWVARN
jgi:hypothetical protein